MWEQRTRLKKVQGKAKEMAVKQVESHYSVLQNRLNHFFICFALNCVICKYIYIWAANMWNGHFSVLPQPVFASKDCSNLIAVKYL